MSGGEGGGAKRERKEVWRCRAGNQLHAVVLVSQL